MSNEIRTATRAVADAELTANRLAEPLTAATAHAALIGRRQADLAASRAGIIARRGGGRSEPGDGAQLALISADSEALAGLATEAAAKVTAAAGPAEAARATLGQKRFELGQAEAVEEDRALTEHADRLASLLVETITRCNAVAARRGAPLSTWKPTPELISAVKKRSIQAGAW